MQTVVETSCGLLEGTDQDTHLTFRGIPYAQPPIEEFRFLPPQPAMPWTGTRSAATFGPASPQSKDALKIRGLGRCDEDCLYLNVTTPALDEQKRPVLFWIHGGGFTAGAGSAPSLSGAPLSTRGNVVVVTINYRLGALGYLHLGGHAGSTWGAAANVGQLDQIAALQWVNDNIGYFGGDPSNVTIFGESAGAAAVATLLAMPKAKGLYQRAIMQSGTANYLQSPETASRIVDVLLKKLAINPAEAKKLQAVPFEKLIQLQESVAREAADPRQKLSPSYFPVIEGNTVPTNPLQAIKQGVAEEIPIIVGSNRDEQKLFRRLGEIDDDKLLSIVAKTLPPRARADAGAMIETYRVQRAERSEPNDNAEIASAIQTDARFRMPAIRLLEAQREHNRQSYGYLFCFQSTTKPAMGACHALEIPFVFGNLDAAGLVRELIEDSTNEKTLSAHMMDAWIAFAHTGNPGHAGIGEWLPYDGSDRATMLFDTSSGMVHSPFDRERLAWPGD
jgi:para-nitrobenzyl esterase|tara:strand:- start:8309 stop:9820 length:1512 start_codon:yes stop_codon:yes gene_type:complete